MSSRGRVSVVSVSMLTHDNKRKMKNTMLYRVQLGIYRVANHKLTYDRYRLHIYIYKAKYHIKTSRSQWWVCYWFVKLNQPKVLYSALWDGVVIKNAWLLFIIKWAVFQRYSQRAQCIMYWHEPIFTSINGHCEIVAIQLYDCWKWFFSTKSPTAEKKLIKWIGLETVQYTVYTTCY